MRFNFTLNYFVNILSSYPLLFWQYVASQSLNRKSFKCLCACGSLQNLGECSNPSGLSSQMHCIESQANPQQRSYDMITKFKTTLKKCSQCKKEVIISYECPNCKLRICMICAIENNWKCPNCNVDVV